MVNRVRSRVIVTAAAAVVSVAAVGCQNDGGNGEVVSRTQDQDVRPDGTAVQTRTQVRTTDSGATVQETQTQQRKVVNPGTGGGTDATRSDPAK